MAPSSSLGTRRALVLYVGAVVGPTLVVLSLGVIAALRQMDALETLQLTTRRLQEARIVEEIERRVLTAAAAALDDPALEPLVTLTDDATPSHVDELRAALPAFRIRHPIVRDVFVLEDRHLVYPRLDPPLLRTMEEMLSTEPAGSRVRVERALAEAWRLETRRAHARAAAAYMRAERAATSRVVQALAAAANARSLALAADTVRATAAYRYLAETYGDTYSRADRPHAVVAALELVRLGETDDARVAAAARDLRAGRWSVTPEQAEYFLEQLGVAAAPKTPEGFLQSLQLARAVRDRVEIQAGAPPGAPVLRAVDPGGDLLQVAYRVPQYATSRVAGVALDLDWIRRDLALQAAEAVVPGESANVGVLGGDHAPFRTILPGWRAALIAPPPAHRWLRMDFVAFAAAIVTVLGVLVMGVVLLMRDVSRETGLNRMRADLVSGVSHELKAPLSVIRLYAETIDETRDAMPEERRQFTDAIIQETDRLQRLVSDVVDYSRIQQDQRPYHLAPGSLAAVVAGAAERSRRYADLHGFTLEADVPGDVPPVQLDVTAVEHAVLNLVDNAFKYSGDSRYVAVRLRREQDEAVVEVQDLGPGIPAEQQSRIFERFHRGTHADRGGYGLGLYLVRHVMDAHEGRVEVDSEPGRGSVFRLRFPCAGSADVQGAAG